MNTGYVIVDVFKEVADAIKTELALDNLNYQYGYVNELNETLVQWSKVPDFAVKKYPLIWLVQPFTISRGTVGFFGNAKGLRLFIIQSSSKNLKAEDRMTNKFKPIIYPIYNELLNQIYLHPAFSVQSVEGIKHDFTDRYYWGEQQQSTLDDVVDCSEVNNLNLLINYQTCKPQSI